jgi:hypothetical protein
MPDRCELFEPQMNVVQRNGERFVTEKKDLIGRVDNFSRWRVYQKSKFTFSFSGDYLDAFAPNVAFTSECSADIFGAFPDGSRAA